MATLTGRYAILDGTVTVIGARTRPLADVHYQTAIGPVHASVIHATYATREEAERTLAARALGSISTPRKAKSSRANGAKGGRPTTADRYLIVQPALSQGDPQRLYSGRVISRHRTAEAARAAYARAHRALQSREPRSWYDWTIVHEVAGERTAVPATGDEP